MSFARVVKMSLLLALGAGLAGCFRPAGPDLHLTLQLSPERAAPAEAALADARETIQRRLELLGFDDAVVETAGRDRLSVRISRVEDSEQVRRVLQSDAAFELRLVRFPVEGPDLSSEDAVLAHFNGQLPPDLEILREEVRGEGGQVVETKHFAVEKQPVITGRDIRSARPSMGQFDNPIVEFRLKPDAAAAFSEATAANIGSRLAIVLDRRVVSAPLIQSRISEYGIIEGGFTKEQALDLAILLSSGPLPARLTLVEERGVGRSGV
jgi:preprotein translocase subunit SecD